MDAATDGLVQNGFSKLRRRRRVYSKELQVAINLP
jgi:hypothetical protein